MLQAVDELIMSCRRSVDQTEFRKAMGDMPGAVTIITTWTRDGIPSGATLSAVVSLSLDPPLMLACFDNKSVTLGAILSEGQFLVHVLAHGQQSLAMHFSSKAPDKFKEIAWTVGMSGLPELAGSVVTIACQLDQAIPAGDHHIVIGRAVEVDRESDKNPMVYARRKLLPFEPNGANS